MESQRLVKLINAGRDLISHSPYVVRGDSNDGIQIIIKRVEAGAIDRVPLCAIPVRCECARSIIPILTHCPHIVGGKSIYGKKAGLPGRIGGGYDGPLGAVPVHGKGLIIG